MIENCYIRVDTNNKIGSGHLLRAEILADELKEAGIDVFFICKQIPETYKIKLENKNYNVIIPKEETPETEAILNNIHTENNLVITDSDDKFFYSKEFQQQIRSQGNKLMTITFYNDTHFYSDIILNQNIMATYQTYSTEHYTIKLLGTKYLILKKDYRILANKQPYKQHKLSGKKTILLTFGGSDADDRTAFVYEALTQIKNTKVINKIIIVLGALYKNKNKIKQLAATSGIPTEIYMNTPCMPHLIYESDIMISSGGLTVWEAAALQKPVIIIAGSDREIKSGKFLANKQLAHYLGTKNDWISTQKLSTTLQYIITNEVLLNSFASKFQKVVDTNGVLRVVEVIKKV